MEVGEIVGKYRVLKLLGEGGMGAVYLAEHTQLGKRDAVKVLLPSLSRERDSVERFFNEARAISKVVDPGIVKVLDFGYHGDGSAYIVMELLEGETMQARLAKLGRFTIVDGLRLLRQICAALAAAHAQGVVHRDLKPDNIFLVRDPAVTGGERAKIVDFGLAKLLGDEVGGVKTRTGLVMGTPAYMSPEQCRGRGEIDHRSDIYAIGCVAFAMLTGRPPFIHPGNGELLAAHLVEPAPVASSRVPELAGAVDALLSRCLAKHPADRFSSMMDLDQAIAQIERAPRPGAGYPAAPAPVPLPLPPADRGTPHAARSGRGYVSTLTGAAGQPTMPLLLPGSPRRRTRLAAIAAIALVGTGAVAILSWGGAGGRVSPDPAATDAARPARAGASRPAEGAALDPAAAGTPNAAPASGPPELAARPVAAPAAAVVLVDAGIADVAPPAVIGGRPPGATPAPHPASERAKSERKGVRQPKSGGEHGSSTGSAAPPIIDRGD